MGGIIAFLRQFSFKNRNDASTGEVICDQGGGNTITADYFQPAGEDSQPLPSDALAVLKIRHEGRGLVIGVSDPKNGQKAAKGEKRLYSRDSAGNEVAEIWVQNDGSVLIDNESGSLFLSGAGEITGQNDAGSFKLDLSGVFSINDLVTVDTSGNIVTPGDINAKNLTLTDTLTAAHATIAGISFETHSHNPGTYVVTIGLVNFNVTGSSDVPH